MREHAQRLAEDEGTVGECGQGFTDLNGEGDAADLAVIHLFDTTTSAVTNLRLVSGDNRQGHSPGFGVFRAK